MHYITRWTTAEFFCCLSRVKKTWQFSYGDLGWIFKTVASPYDAPTGFVARWKLTATSLWTSSLAPCIFQPLALSGAWSGPSFLSIIFLPPVQWQQYSVIENTWALVACLCPPPTCVALSSPFGFLSGFSSLRSMSGLSVLPQGSYKWWKWINAT